jgi:hypothetical protein
LMKKASLMVLISHDLGVLPNLCSKAIWMDHGRIAMFGTPADVIAAYRQSVSKVTGATVSVPIPAHAVEKPPRKALFREHDRDVVLSAMTALELSSDSGTATIDLNASAHQLEAAIFRVDPLYNLKVQRGLDTPGSHFNFRGRNEWYFQSSNGSNPAGMGWYVLMPDSRFFAWVDPSLDLTILQTPIADLPALYANPELLMNIEAPAAPDIVATCSTEVSGGRLTLTWPEGYTGTFLATVFITTGDVETQQSFLVTVREPNRQALSIDQSPTLPFTAAA